MALALGHELDADTFALYRMDEEQVYTSVITDAAGNSNLSLSGVTGIRSGPGSTQFARRFIAAHSTVASGASTSTQKSQLLGEWTVEAWVFVTSFASTNYVIAHAASGDTLGTNYICGLVIGTNGKLSTFMERGSGVNMSFGQTGAGTVPLTTWTHIAVVKTLVNGGVDTNLEFFIDGVSQGGTTLSGKPDGGTSGQWYVGRNGPSADSYFDGQMSSLRVTARARSAAEIAASAADSTKKHTVDGADVMALWQFDEPPAFIDVSGGALHLITGASSEVIVPSLIGDGGRGKFFNGSYYGRGYPGESRDSGTFRDVFLGEWTVEVWARIGDANGSARKFFGFEGASGESLTTNGLVHAQINSSGQIIYFWERGAGVDVSHTTPSLLTTQEMLNTHHYAFRKRSVGAGLLQIDTFIDGVLRDTSSNLAEPEDGGSNWFNISSVNTMFYGRMDDMRVSKIARSDAAILDSYKRGRLDPFLILEE